jgi:uncharacterized protein YjbJ (UPF0337 family)
MTPAQFWQIEQGNQQNRQEFMQGQQEQLMGAIGQFAGQFADNKALEAKGSAYGDFMKRHGDQLGFDPEWIKGFLSESPRQQAMIGDSIIGMQNTGRQMMNMNYLNAQMGPRTAGPATGTGAGGMNQAPVRSKTF